MCGFVFGRLIEIYMYLFQDKVGKAQQNKNYMAKLKTTPKYDEYKKKKAAAMKQYREKKKNDDKQIPLDERANVIAKRREDVRLRVAKCRKKKRQSKIDRESDSDIENEGSQNDSNLSDMSSGAYSCKQSLGKAVKKALRGLPTTAERKNAVLTRIVSNLTDNDIAWQRMRGWHWCYCEDDGS